MWTNSNRTKPPFFCHHCTLVLQNHTQPTYWFGDCQLYAHGRCYHCGFAYTICEHHDKSIGKTFKRTTTIRCQACHHDNLAHIHIIKKRHQGCDDYFGMDLLLQAPFKGHVFWAYHDKHLAELEAFIKADLRERTGSSGNGSMICRLPFWMKSAKNRDGLLKLIDQLKLIAQSQHPTLNKPYP